MVMTSVVFSWFSASKARFGRRSIRIVSAVFPDESSKHDAAPSSSRTSAAFPRVHSAANYTLQMEKENFASKLRIKNFACSNKIKVY